jgi:CxxC-x17-CxxC domain-containing protein
MYEDKVLVCKDCGSEFTFTAGEQKFFDEKGFTNQPQRCKACRMAKKNASRPTVELFETTCTRCGGVARVRFQPKEGRPVYCNSCFAEMRNE